MRHMVLIFILTSKHIWACLCNQCLCIARYISTLYSHKDWPEMHPGDMQEELMNNIDSSLIWLLSPQSIYRYVDRILVKRRNGQPVSFTDIFGHLVGETLLKDVSGPNFANWSKVTINWWIISILCIQNCNLHLYIPDTENKKKNELVE